MLCVYGGGRGNEAESGHEEDESILLLVVVLRERGRWKRQHDTKTQQSIIRCHGRTRAGGVVITNMCGLFSTWHTPI